MAERRPRGASPLVDPSVWLRNALNGRPDADYKTAWLHLLDALFEGDNMVAAMEQVRRAIINDLTLEDLI